MGLSYKIQSSEVCIFVDLGTLVSLGLLYRSTAISPHYLVK